MTSQPDQPFTPSLHDLGWDAFFEAAFAEHASAGLVPARIARVDRGQVTALTAAGPMRANHGSFAVCTGDWVAVRLGDPAEVAGVLPRRTAVVRSSASCTSEGQTLAANLDMVAVVVSLADTLDPGRVERLTALAWDSGAIPLLVLTKADSVSEEASAEQGALAAALAPGVEAVVTSSVNGGGLERLRHVLTGSVVLLGPSGAGKSTLARIHRLAASRASPDGCGGKASGVKACRRPVERRQRSQRPQMVARSSRESVDSGLGNALLGTDRLATGRVRTTDGKGRHTTVHRDLLPLPGGGMLIDTPDLRAVGLHDSEAGLHQVFSEIEELAEHCRFADCDHAGEPGCAVAEAVAAGALPERRLASYRKLQRENAWAASRTDARLRAERENHRRAISRDLRATYDFRGRQR